MQDQLIKLCEECEKEFKISKFTPYVKFCPEHRKGKPIQPSYKQKHKCGCKFCHSQVSRVKMGIYECPECTTNFWSYGEGIYRTHLRYVDGKYWFFVDGVFFKKTSDTSEFKDILESVDDIIK